MIHARRANRVRRTGAAAVEAAVVLPVLMIFIAGIIDIGRLPKYADTLTNAARIGAQYGCANSTAAADAASITTMIKTELSNENFKTTSTNPAVSVATVTASGTKFVQVTVTYNMSGTAFFSFFPISSITRTVQMPMMPE
jgi:Flp pilus assembly protein TadG